MTKPFDTAKTASPVLAAQDVRAYVLANRELFAGDLDLMAALTPKGYADSENVTDLQTFLINRLRSDLDALRDQGHTLIETAAANLVAQDHVHRAVLKLLEARSFSQFIGLLQDEVSALVGADALIICIEAAEPEIPQQPPPGIAIMTPGMVDGLLGEGIGHQFNNGRKRIPAVYGPKARRIRSEALLRLTFGHDLPVGLLVLGSVDEDTFAPDQRAELLMFFARAIERCLVSWLSIQQG